MPSLETHINLIISKKSQKEALEIAALYENPRNFNLSFPESDLTDNDHGNMINKIKMLADEGYINWKYSKSTTDDSGEIHYQVDSMALTVNRAVIQIIICSIFDRTSAR